MTATPDFWKASFSSLTDKWDTPPNLILHLGTVFDWDVDVCASYPNVCQRYFTESIDGLSQSWTGLSWMNPPYGSEIGKWVQKARNEPGTIVCLVPARTDTAWWQNNVPHADFVVFIRGRLKFGGHANSAPFPSAFVVFGQINNQQKEVLASYGWTSPCYSNF